MRFLSNIHLVSTRRAATGVVFAALASSAILGAAPAARADFAADMGMVYNGTAPTGNGPYGRVTVETLAPGTVRLTMANLLDIGPQFVNDWYFNLDPAKNPNDLLVTYVSGQAAQSVIKGVNAVEPPGPGGDFDLQFQFGTANNANRFTANETSVYTITGNGINAESFRFLSQNESNAYLSAMTVQGIPTRGGTASGEIAGTLRVSQTAVPEPGTFALAGMGLLPLAGTILRRRRRRRV